MNERRRKEDEKREVYKVEREKDGRDGGLKDDHDGKMKNRRKEGTKMKMHTPLKHEWSYEDEKRSRQSWPNKRYLIKAYTDIKM
jgi:hypothetical protein